MDCEDNDFQSQNFQLVGEDNDVFPQSLQLYTSSKFDIEDQFQSHLRLDSLSETGLLLGIQGEENYWIEEFSPRNSGVEIGSSIVQTCSTSGHDHSWSSAPSSESAEMLVKSIGDDDTVSPQVMSTLEEINTMDDSTSCGTESTLETNSTLLTDRLHSGISGSNVDDLMANQHAATHQSSCVEKSEIGLDVNLTDEKFHSTRKPVASDDKELTPSSDDVSEASLVVSELPELVDTSEPLGNSYNNNSSLDHHVFDLSRNSEAPRNFVSCNTQDDPLSENMVTITGKVDNQFSSEPKMEERNEVEKNERSDAFLSENGKNETGCCKVNDQNFNSNIFDPQSCSHLEAPSNSIVLSNEGSTKSAFLRNPDEDINYHVKDSNENLMAGEEPSSCMKEVPSLSVERDQITGGRSLDISTGNFLESCDIADPLDLCNDEQENVLKDGPQLHVPSAQETESKMTRVDSLNVCSVNPLISKNSDLVLTEKSIEDESSKGIAEIFTAKFDAPRLAMLNGPSTALVDAENKLPFPVHDKLSPISDTILLSAETKDDIFSRSEKNECTAKLIYSSNTDSMDCDNVQNPEIALVGAQNTNTILEPDNNSIMDRAGVNSPVPTISTNPQVLQSEVDVILEQKEEAVSFVHIPNGSIKKDVSVSSAAKEGNTDSHTSRQPQTVLELDVGGPAIKNFADDLETVNNEKVHMDLTGTCFAATEGTLENHHESCLLDAEGGNQSSLEASCGSPAFISSNEHTLDEMTFRKSSSSVADPTVPISASTEKSVNFTCNVKYFKATSTSEDNENFTVVVQPAADLSKGTKEGSEFFCSFPSSKQLQMSKENSERCLDDVKPSTHTNSKTVEENKGEVPSCATRKGNVSQGVDIMSQEKHGKGREKTQCASPIISSDARDKDQCTYLETSTKICSPNTQTPKMPDSNCSIPSSFFNQPFTDLQQIQLRAQIFVYGSLIQGLLPDEACMVPAFGGTDGGRSLWERAWRASSERLHNQMLPPISCGTHLHQSGISCSPLQRKTSNSPVAWSDGKLPNSTTENYILSSKSPLPISFDNCPFSSFSRGTHLASKQSPSQLNSFQVSQIKQGSRNAAPFLSQSPNSASSFFLSQSSPFASNAQYSAAPVAQTSQIMPVRDSSILGASNMELVSPVAMLHNQGAKNVSTTLFVPVEVQNKAETLTSNKNVSVGEKSIKRTKISAGEDLLSKFPDSQDQSESAPDVLINHVSASVDLYSSTNSSSTVTSSGLVLTSHPLTVGYCQVSSGDTQQGVIFSKEILSQIDHSKIEAENASSYVTSAVKHSQVAWEQMANQRKLGLPLEVEQNLAFASVAAAAAASVAKVAAEVAKIASEAALQAKLMADEALSTTNTWRSSQNCEIIPDSEKNLMTSTPISICKGEDKVHRPSSIISIAQEISRKRVETASAAIKRAENMDAIMKAAEMAAEAVCQAGAIVTMGDPLPFSINELIEAGHKGHWKLFHLTMENGKQRKDVQATENVALAVAGNNEVIEKQPQVASSVDEMSLNNEKSMLREANYGGCELGKAIPTDITIRNHVQGSIQKGSLVEVAVDEDGLRGAWFTAWVLDVKDGKAQVRYKDLVADKGLDKLKEWIPLDCETDKHPQIRLAHSVIVAKSEGIKKRQREVLGNCNWAIGDKVDAWIRNGWWEGIVTGKSEDDDSKLIIHIPAGGNSLTVREWDLRQSLIWKDGQWIEWSHKDRVTVQSHESDIPCEKRQRLCLPDAKKRPETEDVDAGTSSSNNLTDASAKSRPLTGKDMISSTNEKNGTDTLNVRQANLERNGSKMVGVPKPGKKKKFMDASKHYKEDKTDMETGRSDSVQFAKGFKLQASKTNHISKVYARGKGTTNLNPKDPKTLRSQNAQAKSTVDKEKPSVTNLSVSDGGESSLRMTLSNEGRSCTETDNSSHVVSAKPATCLLSVKNTSSSVQAETVKKGKLLSGTFKSKRSEVGNSKNHAKRSAAVIEPRRSNRKIRPTSKLLEGLQSAMIMSKKP